MFDWLGDKIGAVVSFPLNLIRGAGNSMNLKLGVLAAVGVGIAGVLGVAGATPMLAVAAFTGVTIGSGVVNGGIYAVQELLKSPVGTELAQTAIEAVEKKETPGLENQLGNFSSQSHGNQQVVNAERTAGGG